MQEAGNLSASCSLAGRSTSSNNMHEHDEGGACSVKINNSGLGPPLSACACFLLADSSLMALYHGIYSL